MTWAYALSGAAALALLSADLRGIDSHGIARLVGYVRLQEAGRANTRPGIRIIHETPSTAVVDGDSGLGLVVAPFAMQIAIEKARNVGTGWVSVQNSNHFGIAGYYPLKALERDLIGWAMTNTTKLVAPLWGAKRMLGTNPIAIGDRNPLSPRGALLLTKQIENSLADLSLASRCNRLARSIESNVKAFPVKRL